MRIIYLDGQYLKVNTQIIEAFTPGVFKARGVFETMLAVDGFVMDTALHIRRLHLGLKVLGISSPDINPTLLREVLLRNELTTGRVRLMVWQAGRKIHLMAVAMAQHSSKKQYRVGVIETKRPASDRLANVKSLDYGLFAEAWAKAQMSGFDEALLINSRGHIFEASRANIFWFKDKVLYTPGLSSGCLNGITRQQVIKQAMILRIPVEEGDLTCAILEAADAAFLTNSLIGIKPIDISRISRIS